MKPVAAGLFPFLAFYFIKMDLAEGTIPLASFAVGPEECQDKPYPTIRATVVTGDTIETLFALYPTVELGSIERLTLFYELNPHLKKQELVDGIQVILPLDQQITGECIRNS